MTNSVGPDLGLKTFIVWPDLSIQKARILTIIECFQFQKD